jgi:hypothetical protein
MSWSSNTILCSSLSGCRDTLAHDNPLALRPMSLRYGLSAHPLLQPVILEPVDALWTTTMHILKGQEDNKGLLFYQRLHIFWMIICITMILTLPGSAFGGYLLSSYIMFVGQGKGQLFRIAVGIIFIIAWVCLSDKVNKQLA